MTLVADLDDLGIEGPMHSVFNSYDRIVTAAPRYQLQPNIRKTRVFSYNPPTPALKEECARRRLQLEEGEIMEWLGGLIGHLDSDAAKEWCLRQVEELRVPLFEKALTAQSYASRYRPESHPSLRHPKLNFLSRVLPPSTTTPALTVYDEMVSAFFMKKFHCSSLDQGAKLQLHLPVSGEGGFGFTSSSQLAHAAYTSSLLLAMPRLASLHDTHPNAPVFRRLDSCLAYLFAHGVPTGKHLPSNDCVSSFRESGRNTFKIQHWLTQQLHAAETKAFLSSNDKDPNYLRYTGARLKSAGGSHASDWLLQLQPPHYALSEQEMDYASRLRLGDPLCPPDTQCPKCNKPLSSPGDSFHHLCWCHHVRQ